MKTFIILATLIMGQLSQAQQIPTHGLPKPPTLGKFAFGGDVEGNGGDTCARDFARLGRVIYNVLQNSSYQNDLDMERLNEAINNSSISIVSGNLTDIHGGDVPAANDGNSRIFLSKKFWCERPEYKREAAIVLHEYLGIAMPGRDQQYQLSGALYSRVGVSNNQFYSFLNTGTDFETARLEFFSKSYVTQQSIILESKNITSFFNVIGINEEQRHEKRAKIYCEKNKERLELFSLYAAYDSKRSPKWFYQEAPLQTYRFTSSQQCQRLLRKASVSSRQVEIQFGLDTLTIVSFN